MISPNDLQTGSQEDHMKPRSLCALFLIAGPIVIVGGCANTDGVSVVQNEESGYFSSSEYGNDVSRGDMPVYIAGSTFNQNAKAFVDTVVANMQGADWNPHAHFTGTPGPNTSRIYSYAMAFGDPSVTGASLCAATDRPTYAVPGYPPGAYPMGSGARNLPSNSTVPDSVSPGAGVTLVAALCRYDKSTSAVTARVNATGPNDPKFRSLVRTAVLELTRPNQINIQHRGNSGDGGSSGGGNTP
jgi:hypothetical protein